MDFTFLKGGLAQIVVGMRHNDTPQ